MKRSFWVGILFMFPLALTNAGMAGEGVAKPAPGSIMYQITKQKGTEQCIILNRTSPTFERELLSVPPETCVIVIGSWIIKTDFRFKPVEIVSPKNDVWRVAWENLNAPVKMGDQWSLKLKTQGVKQVTATLRYQF